MKIPVQPKERERILTLTQLQTAVSLQIKLWDACSCISEVLGCDLGSVMTRINAISVTSDDGMEPRGDDLGGFLGIDIPGKPSHEARIS